MTKNNAGVPPRYYFVGVLPDGKTGRLMAYIADMEHYSLRGQDVEDLQHRVSSAGDSKGLQGILGKGGLTGMNLEGIDSLGDRIRARKKEDVGSMHQLRAAYERLKVEMDSQKPRMLRDPSKKGNNIKM